MNIDSAFAELRKLIEFIRLSYLEVTEEWKSQHSESINLKKACVADIEVDGLIYRNIMDYVQLLNGKSASITLGISNVCAYSVAVRVKTQNSIEYKIHNYKTGKHEHGAVPIIKCINDLFGIRVFIDAPMTYAEISEFMGKIYQGKYRCTDSSKLDYKATHVYFIKDNQSFPWELQIWNMCDVDRNFASHKKYKQAYTTWENDSRKGGIIHE